MTSTSRWLPHNRPSDPSLSSRLAQLQAGAAAVLAAGAPAAEVFLSAARLAGQHSTPALLLEWWYMGLLTRPDLRAVLPRVWSSADWPQRLLGVKQWTALFYAAGFVTDAPQPAPTGPVVIYRGARICRRRHMAWTTDVRCAERFAHRCAVLGDPFRAGGVFQATIAPSGVLALINGRGENEVVVDPALLEKIRIVSRVRGGTTCSSRSH